MIAFGFVALAAAILSVRDAGAMVLMRVLEDPLGTGTFGQALALGDVNGDGVLDIVVGAPEGSGGRVHVYSGATGQLLFTLTSPISEALGFFGMNLAVADLNGDGAGDVIVGAHSEDVAGSANQGRVYVFSGQSHLLLATLNHPSGVAGANFGSSLAVGDVDGNPGYEIVVGARAEGVGASLSQGRAYIFSWPGGSLLRTLDVPGNGLYALFGEDIELVDVTGDGTQDVLVSAPSQTIGASGNQGRVYAFSGANGALIREFDTPNPQFNSSFGRKIAGIDLGDDGAGDVAIAAPSEDVGGRVDEGRVYVFSGGSGALVRTIDAPESQPGSRFGLGLTRGHTEGELGIGAFQFDAVQADAGRAYSIAAASGALLETLTSPTGLGYSWFGYALAFGDIEGDGSRDYVVGAHEEDIIKGGVWSPNIGRVYIFTKSAADTDADGVADAGDGCPGTSSGQTVDPHGCSDAQADEDGDGVCTPGVAGRGPSNCGGLDNCPAVPNADQANADGDSMGDACDGGDADGDLLADQTEYHCGASAAAVLSRPERIDGAFAGVDDDGDGQIDEALPAGAASYDCDGDGYKGSAEAGTPLCGNGVNDDGVISGGSDDGVVDDGCPGGPPQAGAYSEAQFNIGLTDQDPCGNNGWPLDLSGADNKVTLVDITSFVAPAPKKLNTSPGAPGFNVRWDLNPGPGGLANWIVLNDLLALVAGPAAFPPMLGGAKAFNGPSCPWAP